MKRFRAGMWLILGAILVLSVSGVPAQSAVIFSDDFNTENGGVGVLNYTRFANWAVSDGAVDLIGNGFYDFFPGNGLFVDLDGSTGNAGKMTSTTLSLGAGDYELKFFLGGNSRGSSADTVNVSVEVGLANASYVLSSGAPFSEYTLAFSVASTTPANIVFDHAGGDYIGIILDKVRLNQVPVPEPGTMALFASGLFGLAWGGRRKIRK